MRIFTFSTRFVLLSVLLAAMVVHALIVGVFGVEALSPTTRQNPLDVVATCAGDEYATLTNEGVVCAASTDTWTDECTASATCCSSGEFLKITPTGLACFPLTNRTLLPFATDATSASLNSLLTLIKPFQ